MLGRIRSKFLGRQETRVIVVGLAGCGKSTIVYRLKHGKLDESEIIPTVGFNVECVEYRKMIFSLWDLGGAPETRSFWKFYYQDTQAVIFVVDSSDVKLMEEVREELHRMLTEHELWDAPVLILANKKDKEPKMTPREITEHLQLFALTNRNWYIVDTDAKASDLSVANIHSGLDWLVETLLMPAAHRQEKARSEHRSRTASTSHAIVPTA